MPDRLITQSTDAIPIHSVRKDTLDTVLKALTPAQARFAQVAGFNGSAGTVQLIPDASGDLAVVLFGESDADVRAISRLAQTLPAGAYHLATLPKAGDSDAIALAWLLGGYRFDRYLSAKQSVDAQLVCPKGTDLAKVQRAYAGITLVRDLVNTPACDMGPPDLEAAARTIADAHGAQIEVIAGDELLTGFPMVHAVGRAAARAPRLIDITWGEPDAPKLTLVGKGVCFDTGGLNIKTGTYMRNMKKDMGGAAHVLALGQMVMDAKLPVRLRIIVPAVENNVGGDAFRPGDILATRKGITVEIGNTDAEGRLVLGDALTLADAESPDLLIDMATLTGAARVALGPDLPPFYTDDDTLADSLAEQAQAHLDPMWRMPLWRRYRTKLDSTVADISHIASFRYAGSITAALFLSEFVERAQQWLHVDVFAWNEDVRPGRPAGGEAQGLLALFGLVCARFK